MGAHNNAKYREKDQHTPGEKDIESKGEGKLGRNKPGKPTKIEIAHPLNFSETSASK